MIASFARYGPILLVVWLAFFSGASARDFYVNNVAGSDLADGTAPQAAGGRGPCLTIARALRMAGTGDRIILADTGRPYRESITLQAGRHSGSADRPFEIVGSGAVLEGAAPVPKGAWEHVYGHVFRFAPRRKAYQLLFLNGVPADRVLVERSDRELPDLKPRQWCLFERQVYYCVEQGKLPRDYDLTYAWHTVGITLYEVRHVVIRDVIVQGYQLDGINAHDGVFDATLIGVTCRGNARSGISVGGACQVRIQQCLVGNNGAAQVRTEGHSHTRIVDSDLLDNTAPPLVREGGTVELGADGTSQDVPASARGTDRRRTAVRTLIGGELARGTAY